MSDDQPDQDAAIPWYKSKVIQRLALSLVVQVLAASHLSNLIAEQNLALLVDDLLEAVGIAYAAWALHARATKTNPPVVLTQKKADIANGTPPPPPTT